MMINTLVKSVFNFLSIDTTIRLITTVKQFFVLLRNDESLFGHDSYLIWISIQFPFDW